ncbi:hypothetical protein TRFO_34270 [Tritrichomonas foetus]|uniref:Uncharacterized protein n=1 Tax=Tritrichomonas foetus TaxID=1144522 RepID=A0A1J4JP80_9EUKA|nr:hypothetical protein TRFO_34270 [Tritrichomonas foetus]|eukprot:OHS99325.1 hypothetical protein TRFO_34270 [Tritrichomonas foetus]
MAFSMQPTISFYTIQFIVNFKNNENWNNSSHRLSWRVENATLLKIGKNKILDFNQNDQTGFDLQFFPETDKHKCYQPVLIKVACDKITSVNLVFFKRKQINFERVLKFKDITSGSVILCSDGNEFSNFQVFVSFTPNRVSKFRGSYETHNNIAYSFFLSYQQEGKYFTKCKNDIISDNNFLFVLFRSNETNSKNYEFYDPFMHSNPIEHYYGRTNENLYVALHQKSHTDFLSFSIRSLLTNEKKLVDQSNNRRLDIPFTLMEKTQVLGMFHNGKVKTKLFINIPNDNSLQSNIDDNIYEDTDIQSNFHTDANNHANLNNFNINHPSNSVPKYANLVNVNNSNNFNSYNVHQLSDFESNNNESNDIDFFRFHLVEYLKMYNFDDKEIQSHNKNLKKFFKHVHTESLESFQDSEINKARIYKKSVVTFSIAVIFADDSYLKNLGCADILGIKSILSINESLPVFTIIITNQPIDENSFWNDFSQNVIVGFEGKKDLIDFYSKLKCIFKFFQKWIDQLHFNYEVQMELYKDIHYNDFVIQRLKQLLEYDENNSLYAWKDPQAILALLKGDFKIKPIYDIIANQFNWYKKTNPQKFKQIFATILAIAIDTKLNTRSQRGLSEIDVKWLTTLREWDNNILKDVTKILVKDNFKEGAYIYV